MTEATAGFCRAAMVGCVAGARSSSIFLVGLVAVHGLGEAGLGTSSGHVAGGCLYVDVCGILFTMGDL